MPHSRDDAVLRTSGKSWHWLPLPDPRTQIRLIHFRPGSDDDDEISADFEVHYLNTAPAFNAISYTWGKEPPQATIKISDMAVLVRPNCHYALWQARSYCPGFRVWLDAICIDQSDLIEKASQVANMGNIYAKANNVLACIGHADDSSDAIRDALMDLDVLVQDLPAEWHHGNVPNLELWNPPSDETTTLRLLAHFNEFCKRPYFSRVWITQELFGGMDRISILCGSYCLDWDDLMELNDRLDTCFNTWTDVPYRGSLNVQLDRLDQLLGLSRSKHRALRTLLLHVQYFECDDVRDRIFGTLRLVDWEAFGISPPIPNYQITPLQLAFESASSFGVEDMELLSFLVRGLIHGAEDNYEFESRLETRSGTSNPPQTLPSLNKTKNFAFRIHGAHVIRRNCKGRLSIALEKRTDPGTWNQARVPDDLRLPCDVSDNLDATLLKHGLVPVFTGDEISALACIEASDGDLFLNATETSLVLRIQDGSHFTVFGQAIVVNDYESPQIGVESPCNCWQLDQLNNYRSTTIRVAINVSDEDAIAALGSRG